jgi:hypothetical protein
MEATQRNLQDRPKIIKWTKHHNNQSKQKNSHKKYVQYLKSDKEPKIRLRLNPKS